MRMGISGSVISIQILLLILGFCVLKDACWTALSETKHFFDIAFTREQKKSILPSILSQSRIDVGMFIEMFPFIMSKITACVC